MLITPASFGDNLTEWFRLMGRVWKPLLLSSLVGAVPMGIGVALVFWWTGATGALIELTDLAELGPTDVSELLAAAGPLLWAVGMATALQAVATIFIYVAASRTVAEDRAGLQPSWGAVSRFGISRLVTGVAAGCVLLVGFLIIGGVATALGWLLVSNFEVNFLTVFVTAVVALTAAVMLVWVSISVALYPQAIAMEQTGPIKSLGRSFRLIRNRWWMTVGFLMVVSLIASITAQALSIAVIPIFLWGTVVPEVIAIGYGFIAIVQGPVAAAIASGYAVWYIDLRAREAPLTAEQLVV